MNGIDLAQFGFAAVLIGAFFVPFIYSLMKTIKEKDKLIEELQEKRLQDMKEVNATMIEPLKEFQQSSKSLMVFFEKLERLRHGKK